MTIDRANIWRPDYFILTNDWFARRPKKEHVAYICYRSILCKGFCEKRFDDYEKFMWAYDSRVPLNSTFDLLWSKGDVTLTLVDHTKGCYPLIFYSTPQGEKYTNRLLALDNAVEDMKDKIKDIYNFLEDNSFEYSRDVHIHLTTNIFNYEKKYK